MKKILLLILFATSLQLAYGQCTIDTTITRAIVPPPGSRVDTASQEVILPPAYTGQAYAAVLQFKVPSDTSFLGQSATVRYVQVDAILNLPAGYTLSCNPGNCRFDGGDFGCAEISGIANQPDSVELLVALEYDITYGGLSGTIKDTLGGYFLPVRGQSIGISESSLRPERPRLYPNPANQVVYIDFPRETGENINLKIFSIVGNLLYESNQSSRSLSRLEVPVQHLGPGVYLYRFSSSGRTFSGRFSISR